MNDIAATERKKPPYIFFLLARLVNTSGKSTSERYAQEICISNPSSEAHRTSNWSTRLSCTNICYQESCMKSDEANTPSLLLPTHPAPRAYMASYPSLTRIFRARAASMRAQHARQECRRPRPKEWCGRSQRGARDKGSKGWSREVRW